MLIEELCLDIIESCRYDKLTQAEQDRLYTILCHDIAMAAVGGKTDFARSLLDPNLLVEAGSLRGTGDRSTYTLIGRDDRSLSFDMAAGYHSMAITATLCEDFVSGTHPGAILFPLLIAQTDAFVMMLPENDGQSHDGVRPLLDGAVVGLKLALLLSDMFGAKLADKGYRPTTAINVMAGVAGLGIAQGQTSELILGAMATAAGMISGLAFPFQEGTEEWLVQVPLAVQAALLASRNVAAQSYRNRRFLSGGHSLGQFLGAPRETMRARSACDLSLERIGVKRHPVNSFVQPAVEAALRVPSLPLTAADIDGIVVRVPPSYASMTALGTKKDFLNPNLGLMSIPVSVALALLHGKLAFADFRETNDSAVMELTQKIAIEYTDALARYDAEIVVETRGQRQIQHVDTATFYPSMAEELEWIGRQCPQPVPWIQMLEAAYGGGGSR